MMFKFHLLVYSYINIFLYFISKYTSYQEMKKEADDTKLKEEA